MAHTLPDLPYDYKDLEPFIDKETMKLHHDMHHAGYVKNLNEALLDQPELTNKSIEGLLADTDNIPEKIRQTVINNGGGHANHSLFWKIMAPKGKTGKPEGKLLDALNSTFNSVDKFKEEFTSKAMAVFGSGWVFLQVSGGKLTIKRHSFQNSPLMYGTVPILGLDVWEHAYYLKYQNRRAEYVEAWWNIVNWSQVDDNYGQIK